ncbi:glycosyltransferase family 4 protein [Cobetia marina]
MKTHRMALFVSAGSDHGETRQMLALAAGLTRLGHEVDVVLPHAEEDVVTSLAHGVRLVELGRQGPLALSLALTRYLARHKPCVLMSSGLEANLTALKAARLNRRRVPVVIHHVAALAQELAAAGNRRDAARRAMALKYPQAALVIGASEAITQALASEAGIPQANTAQLDLAPQRIGGAAHAGESSAALEEGL